MNIAKELPIYNKEEQAARLFLFFFAVTQSPAHRTTTRM